MHSNKAFYCSGKCALKERFYLNEIYMITVNYKFYHGNMANKIQKKLHKFNKELLLPFSFPV